MGEPELILGRPAALAESIGAEHQHLALIILLMLVTSAMPCVKQSQSLVCLPGLKDKRLQQRCVGV